MKDYKSVISYDDTATDFYETITSVFENLGIKYEESGEEIITFKYKKPSINTEMLKLIDNYISEKLPNHDTPYHYEAEIASGLKRFRNCIEKQNG